MDHNDFVVELARRLNTFFEQNRERTQAVLGMPLPIGGYASVAHFLGELCMPHGVKEEEGQEGELDSKMILVPKVEEGKLQEIEAITLGEFKQRFEATKNGPSIH